MKQPMDKALLLLLCVVAVINLMWMPLSAMPGDPAAMREESRAILFRGELAISPAAARAYGDSGQYVVKNEVNGRYYSKYGVMNGLFFTVPLAMERLAEGPLARGVRGNQVIYLNFFNWGLALLLAWILYHIAVHFGPTRRQAVLFVLATFYAGFLWHYLRAQNSEIFQVLLFAAAYLVFLTIVSRRRQNMSDSRWLWGLWALVAALELSKISHVAVGPLLALGLAVDRRLSAGAAAGSGIRPWGCALAAEARRHLLPGGLALAAPLLLNTIKFGGPWLTGYHVWKTEIVSLHAGVLPGAVWELLTSVQWGVFFNYPLLLLALPFLRRWLVRWPVEYGTAAVILVVYVILQGMLPTWRGEMGYGPRYFLFALPLAALPAMDFCQWVSESAGRWKARLAALAVAVMLGYSLFLQLQVNRTPFFAFYQLRDDAELPMTAAREAFFRQHSYGRIYYEYRSGLKRLPWWREIKEITPDRACRIHEMNADFWLSEADNYWLATWYAIRIGSQALPDTASGRVNTGLPQQ